MKSLPNIKNNERGQAIVLLVLAMVGLVGAAALAVDGGRAYFGQRTAQNAADNAALSGAYALCTGGNVNTSTLDSAAVNGFDNDGSSNTVTVNVPPATGPNSSDTNYVEVLINSQQDASFSQLVAGDTLESTVRAVARCAPSSGTAGSGNGIIALNPNGNCTIDLNGGSGAIHVQEGGVFVNSNHSEALCINGSSTGPGGGPRISADSIDIVGGYTIPGWMLPGAMVPNPPNTGVGAISDPLADVDPPTTPAHPGGSCTTYNQGWHPDPVVYVGPGLYCSFRIGSDANVEMLPGTYYIEGGNFTLEGNTDILADGVKIYLTSGDVNLTASSRPDLSAGGDGVLFHIDNGDFNVGGNSVSPPIKLNGMIYLGAGAVNIGGSGNVDITPPDSGPYEGMTFYMARGNTSTYRVVGSGVVAASGTIYLPDAPMVVTGSGTNKSFAGQLIAWDITVPGAALIDLTYDEDLIYGDGGGSPIIELSE